MKTAVGILTHNVFRYDREAAFRRTVKSLAAQKPDQLFIVSNGSDDGTEDLVAKMGGTVVNDPISTCGHGMNVTMGICASSGADIVVFSNDDIWWDPWALDALKRFWAEAPEDIALVSGLLEDIYPWNTVRERVVHGGVPALIRDSAPGGCWSFRASYWPVISPVPEAKGWDDVPCCERLRLKGYRVGQIDLATHEGEATSTWGNGSDKWRRPLDPELRASLRVQ